MSLFTEARDAFTGKIAAAVGVQEQAAPVPVKAENGIFSSMQKNAAVGPMLIFALVAFFIYAMAKK